MHDDTAQLLAATATALKDASETGTPETIVGRATELVPGCHHASITVRTRRGYDTIVSTSTLATAVDQSQYTLDEGPCVDSAEQAEWSRSGDLRHDERWPSWGPVAADHGVAAVLSIKLFSRGRSIGALNLYSENDGAFGDRDVVELALLYTVHAANVLAVTRHIQGLETALSTRHEIGIAQGILMCRYRIDRHQAFEVLRRISQVRNIKLRDVAGGVIDTGDLPTDDAAPPDTDHG